MRLRALPDGGMRGCDGHTTCRANLPGVDLDELIDREPMVFTADVPRVLADVQRLLGNSIDPLKYFVANPRELLDMQQGGLPSSAETGSDHAV